MTIYCVTYISLPIPEGTGLGSSPNGCTVPVGSEVVKPYQFLFFFFMKCIDIFNAKCITIVQLKHFLEDRGINAWLMLEHYLPSFPCVAVHC